MNEAEVAEGGEEENIEGENEGESEEQKSFAREAGGREELQVDDMSKGELVEATRTQPMLRAEEAQGGQDSSRSEEMQALGLTEGHPTTQPSTMLIDDSGDGDGAKRRWTMSDLKALPVRKLLQVSKQVGLPIYGKKADVLRRQVHLSTAWHDMRSRSVGPIGWRSTLKKVEMTQLLSG